MQKEIMDTSMASVGAKATYTGAGTISLGWFFSSEAAVIYGLVIGLAGLVTQLVFSFRKDRRDAVAHRAEMKEHDRRMALIEAGKLTRSEDES